MDTVTLSTRFHEIPRGKLVEDFPFHQTPRGFRGKNGRVSAPAHRDHCRDRLDVCALDRSAFYKRRTTPKLCLDFRCSNRRFFAQRLCRCVQRFCRKHAAAIADLWQILLQTYRRRAEREPSADCMACCARSMPCSRAALHVAPRALRQWQARRASRWGRSLPTGDAGNRRKTCPARNQEFCATKAKRGESEMFPAIRAFRWLRDSSFWRATLAPVIQGKTVTQTQCN